MTRSESCAKENIEIVCEKVSDMNFGVAGTVLQCISEQNLIVSTNNASLTAVKHKNKSEVNRAHLAEIQGLYIHDASVNFIPTGIKKKFGNLKVLHIRSCSLLSVSKNDLKEFRDSLEWLGLDKNKITFIDADLLEYNRNLKEIDLSYNPIQYVASQFFEDLIKLKIQFQSAGCMNGITISSIENHNCSDVTTKTKIENLLNNGNSKCFLENTVQLITTHINDDNINSAEKSEVKIDTSINSFLTNKVNKIENSIEMLSQKVDQLTTRLNDLIDHLL